MKLSAPKSLREIHYPVFRKKKCSDSIVGEIERKLQYERRVIQENNADEHNIF